MRFLQAVDKYFEDMRAEGRIRSERTEVAYRQVLEAHAEDVTNRDPSLTGREDVKRTLARWEHANTRAKRHAVLVSFYDWAMTEAIRNTNPARMVRRPREQPTTVYRLTRQEATSILHAAHDIVERRISHLGICAGIRNAELRGLQGRHFQRDGFIWVSSDIAKGNRERWVPVLPELAPIVAEIRRNFNADHYVLPARSAGGWGPNSFHRQDPTRAMSSQTVQRIVHQVAKRAGIAAHIHPHLLRHAFADHIARQVSITQAQRMLGHAQIQTTQRYVGEPTLEELAQAIKELRFADRLLSSVEQPAMADTEREGFEPSSSTALVLDWHGFELPERLADTVRLYAEHFRRLEAERV